jgi:hypothetical protein
MEDHPRTHPTHYTGYANYSIMLCSGRRWQNVREKRAEAARVVWSVLRHVPHGRLQRRLLDGSHTYVLFSLSSVSPVLCIWYLLRIPNMDAVPVSEEWIRVV